MSLCYDDVHPAGDPPAGYGTNINVGASISYFYLIILKLSSVSARSFSLGTMLISIELHPIER